jgi:hypothetical protein
MERPPERLELAPQLRVVVDLAIEDEDTAPLGIPHRLRAARDVEDGEPPLAEVQPDAFVDESALAIRTAMDEGIGHLGQDLRPWAPDESDDPAHVRSNSLIQGEG